MTSWGSQILDENAAITRAYQQILRGDYAALDSASDEALLQNALHLASRDVPRAAKVHAILQERETRRVTRLSDPEAIYEETSWNSFPTMCMHPLIGIYGERLPSTITVKGSNMGQILCTPDGTSTDSNNH